MPPKLTVSQNVIDRLEKVKEPCSGNLYGVLHNNTLLLIGFHIYDDHKSELIHGFPTEIDVYGILDVGNDSINEEKVKQVLICNVDVTDTPVYMTCKISKDTNLIETYFNINNRFETAAYEIMSVEDIYSQFVHIRLMTSLPFISGTAVDAVKDSFTALRKQLAHGQIVFNFPKTNIFIMGNHDNENGLKGLSGDPSVGEVCKLSSGTALEGCGSQTKKKKGLPLDIEVLRVVMFKKITKDPSTDNFKMHAPVVHIDKRHQETFTLPVNIDALSIAHRDAKVVQLYPMLVESCCRYLRLLEAQILKSIEDSEGDYAKIAQPETFHFFPEMCGHFITKAYTKSENEKALENARLSLHKQLLLPLGQPFFRRANRYIFKGDVQGSGLLVNPHEGLSSSGNGGEIALVRGKYSYYHYSQDGVDDNGWGCAYRSLQTLASWFLWQGYSDKAVPTFEDIQKCLVNIGDKPSNFIGSKQWIGSTEVNFVLNTLMNITCKIMYISSGEEMGSKGQELLNHFQTNGSPIMIGGGVLAHTILGVDYNTTTGSIKFLILDPHYTGAEDLSVIQKKGWCGWKSVDFWDKTAYYNMCLPQVPSCI